MREPTMEDFKLMDKILCDLIGRNKSTIEFENDFPDQVDKIDECLQELLSFEFVELWAEEGGEYCAIEKSIKTQHGSPCLD